MSYQTIPQQRLGWVIKHTTKAKNESTKDQKKNYGSTTRPTIDQIPRPTNGANYRA
jgi:hypothetical protein